MTEAHMAEAIKKRRKGHNHHGDGSELRQGVEVD